VRYQIADLTIQMNPKYDRLKNQAKPYEVIDGEVDFVIPDISEQVNAYHLENSSLSVGECEYIMYASYFYTKLVAYGGIYLHASAVVKDECCYLFSAPSGTGKSTHTKLWLDLFKDAFILNDDKPAIRVIDGLLYAYGTPFSGKHDMSRNERYLLKGICFIQRSMENWIRPLPMNLLLPKIFEATVKLSSETTLNESLKMLEQIIENIPIYQLGVNMDLSAARLAYETMKEVNK